jgi:hypothetical protein
MARGILWIVLMVCALLLAGCSSHAPSASKFMNVKPHSLSMGFGGAAVVGDYYDEVVQRDDDGHDSFTEIPFMLEGAALGRVEHFVLGVALETSVWPRFTAGIASDYFGVQTWVTPFVWDEASKPNRPFGIMLIEQYPIQPNFNVGFSQFFSNNSYGHIDSPDCCSLNADHYTVYYKELGVGFYITYKILSFEFRYGNELESGNDRFYFDINLMFNVNISQKKKDVK